MKSFTFICTGVIVVTALMPAGGVAVAADPERFKAEIRAELEQFKTEIRAEIEAQIRAELEQAQVEIQTLVSREFAFASLAADILNLEKKPSRDELQDLIVRLETVIDDPDLNTRPQAPKLVEKLVQTLLKNGYEDLPAAVGADFLNRETSYAYLVNTVRFALKRRRTDENEVRSLAKRLKTIAADTELRVRPGFSKIVDGIVRLAVESESGPLLEEIETELQALIPLSPSSIVRLARHYGENLVAGRYALTLTEEKALAAFHRYLSQAREKTTEFASLLPLHLMVSERLPAERQDAEIAAIQQQILDLDPAQQAAFILQTVRYIGTLFDRNPKSGSEDLLAIAGGRMVDANRRLLADVVADPLVNLQLNQLAWREADAGNQGLAKNLYEFIRTLSQSISGRESLAFESRVRGFVQTQLEPWIRNAIVVYGIKRQNQKTRSYSEEQIAVLDRRWRGETASGSFQLIQEVLDNPLSRYLQRIKAESDGLYREIFVMDAVGLNVAASNPTSDYWQGDEAKWRETYLVGADGLHISEMEFDESTLSWQIQISLTVTDPQTGEPIGAITVGIEPGAIIH